MKFISILVFIISFQILQADNFIKMKKNINLIQINKIYQEKENIKILEIPINQSKENNLSNHNNINKKIFQPIKNDTNKTIKSSNIDHKEKNIVYSDLMIKEFINKIFNQYKETYQLNNQSLFTSQIKNDLLKKKFNTNQYLLIKNYTSEKSLKLLKTLKQENKYIQLWNLIGEISLEIYLK